MNDRPIQAANKSPKSGNQSRHDNPVADRRELEPQAERSVGDLQLTGGASGGSLGLRGREGASPASEGERQEVGHELMIAQVCAIAWEKQGAARFTKEQEAILRQPVNPDLVEIRYDGVIYMPGAYYRKVLNDCFGPGGWTLVETGPVKIIDGTYYLQAVLVCEGRPIATAIGEYQPGGFNPKVSPGMAKESCRTDAISKACKTLGVAEELWFPAWCRKWQAEYAIQAKSQRSGRLEWRRKDDMAGAEVFKPGYTSESEYGRPARIIDENQAHLDAINARPLAMRPREPVYPADNYGDQQRYEYEREPGEEG